MRVLVLNDKRSERDAIVRALPQDAYQVEAVPDERAAIAAISREVPHVVIFAVPGKGGVDLVGRLRGADASGDAYLIALLESTPAPRELSALLSMGVHDFVRRPLFEGDILERVKAPVRVARWARAVAKPSAFGLGMAVDLTRLDAWKELGALVGRDLSQTLANRLTVFRGGLVDCLHVATIALTLAAERIELRVSIALDGSALRWLAEHLLGDPAAPACATDDCLRELANMAGGAVKRAALIEGVTFTTGIPRLQTVGWQHGLGDTWTLELQDQLSIGVIAEVHQLTNQRLSAAQLAEGMVLAHDVRNEAGVLLIPAGARLTSTSAIQLARMLGPRFYLEVVPN